MDTFGGIGGRGTNRPWIGRRRHRTLGYREWCLALPSFNPGAKENTMNARFLRGSVAATVASVAALLALGASLLLINDSPVAASLADDGAHCGAPSIDRSQDRDLFIWQDCGSDQWQVLASSGSSGPDGRVLYSFYEGTIIATNPISNVQEFARTIDARDRLAFDADTNEVDFYFGLGSGRRGIDSFTFDGDADGVVCLDMARTGRDGRVRVGANATIVETFPVNLLDLGADCTPPVDPEPEPEPFVSECLGRAGNVVRLTGEQDSRYRLSRVDNDTVFDARGARWSGVDADGDAIPWTVTFRDDGSGSDSCWFGGEINGPWDENADDVSWEDPFHHSGAMTIDIPNFLFEGVRVNNQGDGLRPYGADAAIRSVWLSDIHDDCVENDDLYGLTIVDSLFDGCYAGFSARPFIADPPDGSGNVWSVENSLLRLEPQPTVYRGPTPGHGGFFKWDDEGHSPRVALHNTILRADQSPNHGTLGIPEGLEFESCSNNTMVWLGDGPFPEALPSCFTITTDVSVWDDAVADWRTRHASVFGAG